MATNITGRVIKLIALDNQLISVVEDGSFLCHLEFLNPQYALPSLHYITSTPLSSYNMLVCAPVSWVSYSRACKTDSRRDARCVWYKEAMHPCLFFTWQRKEYVKAVDDMKVPSVCCVSHTLQLAVHKGLLSQCSDESIYFVSTK